MPGSERKDTPVATTAEARVFGHSPAPATLQLIPRSTRWRGVHAGRWWVAGAVLAPLLAVLPPHAPWGVAAALTGLLLGLRRWRERYTLVALDGRCPRCEAALELGGATPLATPHSLSCPACGNLVTVHAELPEPGRPAEAASLRQGTEE